MTVTKTRVIYSDVVLVVVPSIFYSISEHNQHQLIGLCLLVLFLLIRSVAYHINYYKSTGKIY